MPTLLSRWAFEGLGPSLRPSAGLKVCTGELHTQRLRSQLVVSARLAILPAAAVTQAWQVCEFRRLSSVAFLPRGKCGDTSLD